MSEVVEATGRIVFQGWHGRRPVVYDPVRDVVYVGSMRAAHEDVLRYAKLFRNDDDDPFPEDDPMSFGWVGSNPEGEPNDYVYFRGTDREIGWYRDGCTRPPTKAHMALAAWWRENYAPA